MTLARLLAKVLPAIYADPQRVRQCARPGCERSAQARYCSPACREQDQADLRTW